MRNAKSFAAALMAIIFCAGPVWAFGWGVFNSGGKAGIAAADSSLRVSSEDSAPSYSCDTALFTPAATPTDIAAIFLSSYGRSLSVKKITVSGTSTSGGQVIVRLQKSANGGVGGFATPFIAKRDQTDTSASGVVWQFTANRSSLGNGVSSTRPILREAELQLGVEGTSPGVPVVFDFTGGTKAPALKQLTDWLVVNLNGQTMPSGTKLRVTFDWQEQRVPRVAAIGDSTTSNATNGYLNNGANNGGMGVSGVMNSVSVVDNLGSNGFRLYDFINNLNGVTFPMSQAVTQSHDIWNVCYGINDIRTGQIGADQTSATNRLVSMIDTVIYGALNGATSGQTYVSPKATAYSIQSITWSGGVATVATAGPHGFGAAETCAVNISGVSPAGYNVTAAITVTGANTFTVPIVSSPGSYSSGGSVAFATVWPATWTALPDLKIILWGPNSFTSDDAGDGPHYYLSAAGNSTLSGIWSGLTLAQASQAASDILYNAYAAFVGDSRVVAVVQKQDGPFGRVCQNTTAGGLMANQLHPNARGQSLEARQIIPVLLNAIKSTAANFW